jgi:proteasome lid subunit RPN8/RPN11
VSPPSVTLSPSDRAQLSRLALAASPAECCGLLVGRQGSDGLEITSIHQSENLADDKDRGFEIDFRVRLRLEKELASGPIHPNHQEKIIGLYHSHPDGKTVPSAKDLEDAAEAGLVWLILAVDGVGAVDISAWKMIRSEDVGKSFAGLPVVVKR